jgi:hypothetical protein
MRNVWRGLAGMALCSVALAAPAAFSQESYDISPLDPQVRGAVEVARAAATTAEAAASRARAASVLAHAAAARARANEPGAGVIRRDNFVYEGEIRDGRPKGYGVFAVEHGSDAGLVVNDRMVGAVTTIQGQEVMRCELQSTADAGIGICYWHDGARHAGHFGGGNKNGPGVAYFADGRRYEGDFFEDAFDGLGVLWSANGQIERAGMWRRGRFQPAEPQRSGDQRDGARR